MLGSFINAFLQPFLSAASHAANAQFQNEVLSPEALADMVVRGHKDQAAAASEAAQSGISANRFDLLVRNAGSPPGPQELARALRLGYIPEDAGSDTAVGYIQGIRQSRLQTVWAEVIKRLAEDDPSPLSVVNAVVRGQLTEAEAPRVYARLGGNPDFWALLYNNAGEGPSPNEAAVAARRGAIPWQGIGPEATSFEQAVRESSFRNKWQATFQALARYYPPPRTIQAMYREGTLDQARATDWLQKYGVDPADVPFFLTKAQHQLAQKVHEASEALIIKLYVEKAINAQQFRDTLKAHGYSDNDITLIQEAADLQETDRRASLATSIIKKLYTEQKIDHNAASSQLDSAGVLPANRDYLLKLWDLERQAGTKSLTEAQVIKAFSLHLLSQSEAQARLQGIGYSADDAGLLMAIALEPLLASQAGQLGMSLAAINGSPRFPPGHPDVPGAPTTGPNLP